jgi:hypothetical protein
MIRVWKYDVYGNRIDGWQVNDRYEVGSYKNMDHIMEASDEDIISWLKDEGHLMKGTHMKSFEIEGDGENYLTVDFQGKPTLEVTK